MARGILDRALRMGEGKQFKEYESRVDAINALEPEMELLDDAEMRPEADKLRERAKGGESLDDLLPEAFALTREAARRTLGQRHYDVQLIGGMVLHSGAIAEMKTGEGKTLTATLAVFLNTLAGDSVHLVTVNDYLARRDAEWMAPLYEALGVTVRRSRTATTPPPRREKYARDVTYGTNSEFGFDYLRDNMAGSLEECVQRGHHFAIVDEVDNILIDEARTPLIISGRPEQAADLYYTFARLAKQMEGEEHKPKLKCARRVQGHLRGRVRLRVRREAQDRRADRARGREGREVPRRREPLPRRARHARQPPDPVAEGRVALQARQGVRRGRRPGDDHRRVHRPHPRGPALVRGPAPGVEAKEGVAIREENQTLATITLQNYFRLYDKLSGMTGTALTEATEFMKIYKIPTVEIPTNVRHGPRRPERRDLQDQGRQVEGRRQRDRGPQRRRASRS